MLFKALADGVDANTELGNQLINLSQDTNKKILDAVGISSLVPSSLQQLQDGAYNASRDLNQKIGDANSTLLRNLDRLLDPSTNEKEEEDESEHENQDEAGGSIDIHAGAHRGIKDARDFLYKPTGNDPADSIDLRSQFPPVLDQGHLMSCTANAVASAFEFCVQAQKLPEFTPSRLFIWYNARAKSPLEDAVKRCVGCTIKNAVQSLDFTRHGVCSEELWPYEIDKYNEETKHFIKKDARAAKKPPASVEKDAHLHSCTRPHYRRISGNNLSKQIEDRLTANRPVLFGISPHLSLSKYVGDDGRMRQKYPIHTVEGKENDHHRHSLLIVGYHKATREFIVRNSWGPSFGDSGYFYMPYSWIAICYDFWTIDLVNEKLFPKSKLP